MQKEYKPVIPLLCLVTEFHSLNCPFHHQIKKEKKNNTAHPFDLPGQNGLMYVFLASYDTDIADILMTSVCQG